MDSVNSFLTIHVWFYLSMHSHLIQNSKQQECIPVGCVPPAHWPVGCVPPTRMTILGGGGVWPRGCLTRGMCLTQALKCLTRGCTMWANPSCIWCHLYAASTPAETHQQCTCFHTAAWSCAQQGMLGYPPPPNGQTHSYKIITFTKLICWWSNDRNQTVTG